ncbi:MAG: Na+/H+ antiporter subunit C [Thiohalocapsa sp.]|jgi:multicomponent K+:H+ antiporter subunit C|uniref:Na+/H+ antiporter subunit C n=1 Tax=Thiohalocapsa sp. TaxID=2497641 RepID=UPI0025D68927|nr:Na+/H+ antiporter subunit C [Thiohalocapsa sp.]MCG6943410.1 Na+/H+ antiporter subunit C [Thiohalocapsa sp.]
MEWLVAGATGLLMGAGVYLLLAPRAFTVVLGLLLLSYGANLLVFAAGGLTVDRPPLAPTRPGTTDPLPQALVLTAIVIGLAMTAFALALVLWSARRTGVTPNADAGAAQPPADGRAPAADTGQPRP